MKLPSAASDGAACRASIPRFQTRQVSARLALGVPMSTTVRERPLWPVKMTRIAFFVGILAVVLLVIAGPAYRLRLLPLVPALLGAAIGFLLFVVTFVVGSIGLIAGGRQGLARSRAAVTVIALSLVITVVAGIGIFRARGAPPIHDVTTDLNDPPLFKDAVPLRLASGALNPVEYQRIQSIMRNKIDVPAAQQSAYPDIQPLLLTLPPARAVQLAQAAAKDMGWDILAAVPSEGRVEATDTTWYFGFKDDVVVRVKPESAGSRIDVRSESRVGGGDTGTNARRVRAYLARVRDLAGK
jgi:uncharacterized protein (DUF1499 family)